MVILHFIDGLEWWEKEGKGSGCFDVGMVFHGSRRGEDFLEPKKRRVAGREWIGWSSMVGI